MTQETHTQGKSSSALQRLEKDLIDPDVDDFQSDPPTARHGRRISSEIYSATDSESDDESEEDSSKEVPSQLSRHGSVARESDQDEPKVQLPLIERARLVEFRDVLRWVEANTQFTTGKPWSATPKEDAPRMACQDVLSIKKKPEFVLHLLGTSGQSARTGSAIRPQGQ